MIPRYYSIVFKYECNTVVTTAYFYSPYLPHIVCRAGLPRVVCTIRLPKICTHFQIPFRYYLIINHKYNINSKDFNFVYNLRSIYLLLILPLWVPPTVWCSQAKTQAGEFKACHCIMNCETSYPVDVCVRCKEPSCVLWVKRSHSNTCKCGQCDIPPS
jgi:hypothetical protein